MTEKKMTAEEWHKLAAKSLAKENEKIIGDMVSFLREENNRENERRTENYEKHLRDNFAAAAIQGMLSTHISITHKPYIVDHAYELADLMLKERNK